METIENARMLVDEIVKRRWVKISEAKPDLDIVAHLLKLIRGRRLYLITTDEDLIALWDEIRASQKMTDFIISSSVELHMRMPPGTRDGYHSLIDQLAAAYGGIVSQGSVIDQDTQDRLPNMNFRKLLERNNWFVFVLILETLPIFEHIEYKEVQL